MQQILYIGFMMHVVVLWFFPLLFSKEGMRASVLFISHNHRIVEWFGLEGTLKGHRVPTPLA